MRDISRRGMIGLGAGATAALGLAACGTADHGASNGASDSRPGKPGRSSRPGTPKPTARPIGDGSTSFTGKQPKQPKAPVPLEPGETPPQFVIFSWDGAGRSGPASSPGSCGSPRSTTRT